MIRKSGYRLSVKFMSAAFDNPDHVAIVIHNYRWRLGLAAGEASSMPTGIDRQTAPARRAEQDNPNPISKRRTASRFGMSPADGSGGRDVCATVDKIFRPHSIGSGAPTKQLLT
jgi:hypothetical protein